MNNKMKRFMSLSVIVSLVLLTAGTVQAVDFLPEVGDWNVATNWSDSTVPTAGADVKVSNVGGAAPSTATIGSGVNALANRVRVGYSGGGTLNIIDGGTLTTTADDVRVGWQDVGTLNLVDGTITVGKDFEVGSEGLGSAGSFNMTDGTVNALIDFDMGIGDTGTMTMDGGAVNIAKDLNIGKGSTGLLTMNGGSMTVADDIEIGKLSPGTLTLNAGTIILDDTYEGDSHLRLYADGLLHFGGAGSGTVLVFGDDKNVIEGYIANGWITSDLGTAAADLTTNPGYTTVYAVVPEPATMGLMVVVGGGMLFLRRRRTI